MADQLGLNPHPKNGIKAVAHASSFVHPHPVNQSGHLSYSHDNMNATDDHRELLERDSLMDELDCSDEKLDSGTVDACTSGASASEICLDSIETHLKTSTPVVPTETTLMVHMSETKCHFTLLRHDGAIKPMKNFEIPLCLALIRRKAFVFGSSAHPYAQQGAFKFGKYKVVKWDLGRQLLESGNSDFTFNYNENVVRVRVELLFALFLQHLKVLVEEKLKNLVSFIPHIKHVIFGVPLWFTSQHRQRIKDSAEIAGFEKSTIVNDISSISWFRASSVKANLGKPFNLLVFAENSGNVDLAVYMGVTGVFIKMVAVVGNKYFSMEHQDHVGYAYLRDLVKLRYAEVMKATDRTEEEQQARKVKFRGYLIRTLLNELRQKCNRMADLDNLECLVIAEDQDWGSLFEDELKKQDFKCSIHVFQHAQLKIKVPTPEEIEKEKAAKMKNIKNNNCLENNNNLQNTYDFQNNNNIAKNDKNANNNKIVEKKIEWSPPAPFLEELSAGIVIRDLLPYALCQNSGGLVEDFPNICEVDAVASNGMFKKSVKLYPTRRSMIYQRGVKDCYEVGTLEAPPESFYQNQYAALQLQLKLCNDGIIEMNAIYIQSNDGKQKVKLEGDARERFWIPGKLSKSNKEQYENELKKMVTFSTEYQNDLSKLREELWDISQQLADSLWSRNFRRTLGQRRKAEIQKNVDEIRAMLRHITSGPSLAVGETDLKKLLKMVKGYKRYFIL